jgi:SAM-dependent methyltransferase
MTAQQMVIWYGAIGARADISCYFFRFGDRMEVHKRCRERVDCAESFDEEQVEPTLIPRFLRDLEKVNRYLLGTYSVLAHITPLLAKGRGTFCVVDVGCGGGEVLRAIARRARAHGRPLVGIGLDRSRHVLAYAREQARNFPELTWVCADALALPFPPQSFNVVISSTVWHHLTPEQAVTALRGAHAIAHERVIISDLVRSYSALLAFGVFSRLAGFCELSREDGLISVCRAYRPKEFAQLAVEAGLSGCRVYRYPFARMTLVCSLPEEQDGTEPCREL